MAIQTLYLGPGALAPGFDALKATPVATATMPTGWTVAKVASGRYAKMVGGQERTSSAFSTTVEPNSAIDGVDCFVSSNTFTGTFASGNWDISAALIAVGAGGAQDGRLRVRVFQGPDNVSGFGAVEMTTAATALSTVTNLGTGASQNSSGNVSVTQNLTLDNAYIYIQVAWEITGAGGNNSADVLFRSDSTNSRVITTDFTAIVAADAIDPFGTMGFFGT